MLPRLVSILIPSYNAELWISETIESALSQTWDKKEIIIVDDGSTDNTLRIAKQYESSLVKVIAQENRGANEARNRALEYAQGSYLQWLDADDLLAPDKIEKQMVEAETLSNPHVLLTSSWAKFYYRSEKAKFIPDNLWRDLAPVEWLITKFTENAWMNPAVWLVSRTLTELAGPWDEKLARDQDGEYISRVVSRSEGVKFVPESRSYYRQCNQQSLSRRMSQKSLESILLAKSLAIQHLRSLEDSERTREACLAHLKRFTGWADLEQAAMLEKATALGEELGGKLSFPTPSWKYSMVEKALGARCAKNAQGALAVFKTMIFRNWDKLLNCARGPVR
jgi:glycosyltransferase involved in cell wall biosynthesis